MIAKILNYFNIEMLNLQYRYSGQAQEFSQHKLINMGYFWDENRRVYYFCMGKNDRKIYNFDDPSEFGDESAETHMLMINQLILLMMFLRMILLCKMLLTAMLMVITLILDLVTRLPS